MTVARGLLLGLTAVFSAASAESGTRITLANGDVLTGVVVDRDAGGIVLDHPVLGRLTLEVDRLARSPEAAGLPEPAEPLWQRSIELGVSGSEGNTEVLDAVAALEIGSENEERRWDFSSRFFHSRSDGAATKSQARTNLSRDWLFPGRRTYAFSEARYDYDRFEAWDHRLSLGAGPGFDWIQDSPWTLRTNAGLFVTRTFGAPGRDRIDPEAGFELELGHVLGRSEWEFTNALRASLRDPGELRLLTRGAWKIRLTEEGRLAFKVGFENEWESESRAGEDRNDVTYYGTLVLDF